jgi:hypothetical protein
MGSPLGAEPGISLAEVGLRIERAARLQSWHAERRQPGLLIVTKRRGRHVGSANIRYDMERFDISLRSSSYLRETPDGKIHKLYNEWVQALERTIRREVAAPN